MPLFKERIFKGVSAVLKYTSKFEGRGLKILWDALNFIILLLNAIKGIIKINQKRWEFRKICIPLY